MNNQLFGILTVIFCAISIFFSWQFQKKNNYKIAVLLIVICGLALRFYTSTDFFLHSWDERYHALVAKNLIHHPLKPTLYVNPVLPYDYKNWTANHIWLHKQPLPLWAMAASMYIFGVNELALRLPSILLSTIGILLIYLIGSFFFNRKVGYLSAFFYSINGLIIELTGGRVATDHIDIFFLFFIELAIFLSVKFVQTRKSIYNLLAGIGIGAAILSKWLPALIVFPVWFLLIMDLGKFKPRTAIFHFFVLMTACLLTFLPWQAYIFNHYPLEAQWEANFNIKHITEALDEQTGPFYYFIDKIRINYGELIYLPLFWFTWKTLKHIQNKKHLAILIWFWIPLFFFSAVKTKMQAYILFTSPALFMMASEFWNRLSENRKTFKLKWLISFLLILLIALPVRYTFERAKFFEKRDRNPLWVSDLKKFNNAYDGKYVLFNYSNPIEAMFYTNLTVYPDLPDKEIILELIEKGIPVIINDEGEVPGDYKKIEGVLWINLFSENHMKK